MSSRNRNYSELEAKIRSIVLDTLNMKITDNGFVPDTSVERINQGIKQMTEWVAQMLEKQGNSVTRMSYNPKRRTIINNYIGIYETTTKKKLSRGVML